MSRGIAISDAIKKQSFASGRSWPGRAGWRPTQGVKRPFVLRGNRHSKAAAGPFVWTTSADRTLQKVGRLARLSTGKNTSMLKTLTDLKKTFSSLDLNIVRSIQLLSPSLYVTL